MAAPAAPMNPPPGVVDPACIQYIQQVLESKKPVKQELTKYGLAYTATLTPQQLLCHPHNRSKGMVNHLDMWDKGAKMLQVGVSRQFIGHSLAIELAIDPVQRQFQLDANQALIQQADGGLAPMTGQERFLTIYEVLMCFYHCFCFFPILPHPGYLTLSSSHTTAFLRAIQHGCQPKLESQEGSLDISKDDPCWDLITNGWQWTVLSHLVEAQFPQLPTMLQSSLNSPNQVMKAANELELAAQLAQYFSLGVSLQDAKEQVMATNTCPKEVVQCPTHMVQNYCGGPPFPFIKLLQAISAWFGIYDLGQVECCGINMWGDHLGSVVASVVCL